MKTRVAQILFVAALMLVGCSSSTKTSSTPSPTDPNAPPSSLGSNGGTVDPRLPQYQLDHSVALKFANVDSNNNPLTDAQKYARLTDLAGNLFFPMVGDVRVNALFDDSSRTTELKSSTFYLSFEDQHGFWGIMMKSVDHLALRSSTNFDSIYSGTDSDTGITISFRVLAGILNGNMVGSVYYRVHAASETQCNKLTSCTGDANYCAQVANTLATDCRNYMDVSQTALVKQLGTTFTVPYSTWAIQP